MTDNVKPGFFSKQKLDNSYKQIPKPKSAFTSDNTDLLGNIQPEEDTLKTNNKSLGIPAIVWCEFTALLDTTDNDYAYELLEELIHERTARFTHDEKVAYDRNLERKKEHERERIYKKEKKKRMI